MHSYYPLPIIALILYFVDSCDNIIGIYSCREDDQNALHPVPQAASKNPQIESSNRQGAQWFQKERSWQILRRCDRGLVIGRVPGDHRRGCIGAVGILKNKSKGSLIEINDKYLWRKAHKFTKFKVEAAQKKMKKSDNKIVS